MRKDRLLTVAEGVGLWPDLKDLRIAKLEAGLREVIAHHERLNELCHRPRANSHTIKLAEDALKIN